MPMSCRAGSCSSPLQSTITGNSLRNPQTETNAFAPETDLTTSDEESPAGVSAAEMAKWAENDYCQKTGTAPAASSCQDNGDGTLTITLLDQDGSVLDIYTVNANDGIGVNSSGEEVNLPQTGVGTASPLLTVTAAFLLIGFGAAAVKASGTGKRKEDDEA